MCMMQTPAPVCRATSSICGIAGKRRHIVDDFRPQFDGGLRDGGFRGVDRNWYRNLSAYRFDDRQHAVEFFLLAHRLRTRPGAFAADIDQIGAVGDQLGRMLNGGGRIEKVAAVGEAIRRHVDDAHQQRPAREFKQCACGAARIEHERIAFS